MAGIYIHIPFCKKACNYCNFHFSTSLQKSDEMVNAIICELAQRIDYLNDEIIETVYIGGGTPSILSIDQIQLLVNSIKKYVSIESLKEFTIECNPDDINEQFLAFIKEIGITRISLGVQSFKKADLLYMNRAHNSVEAMSAIQLILANDFLLSIDLIYGTPGLSNDAWLENIKTALALQIPHISAYALTVEPKTALSVQIKKGLQAPVIDEVAAKHFEILVESLQQAGYEQYEISNFAVNKMYAIHNTNYWKGKKYLGIGPSAHSYNGTSRSWNIANNTLYINNVQNKQPYFEMEQLSIEDNWNEYIMTSLRTIWGIDKEYLKEKFPKALAEKLPALIKPYLDENKIIETATSYCLTDGGKLFADAIASDLFIITD